MRKAERQLAALLHQQPPRLIRPEAPVDSKALPSVGVVV
jgi:hypothetical protein